MPDLPHATVATIVTKDEKFLMVCESSHGEQVYNQPAGHLESGETLIEAAIRETLEETAWHVKIEAYLGVYQHHAPENGVTYLRHCFVASPLEHEAERELDPDIVSVHWFSQNEIMDLQDKLRSPMVLRAIQDYLSGDTFPLTMFR